MQEGKPQEEQGPQADEGGALKQSASAAFCALALGIGLIACGDGDEKTASPSWNTTQEQIAPEAGVKEQRTRPDREQEPKPRQSEPKAEVPTPSSRADRTALRGIDASIEAYGHTATGSEEKAIVSSLQDFTSAKAGGNYQQACDLLIAFVRDRAEKSARQIEQAKPGALKQPGCPGVLEASLERTSPRLLSQAAEIDVALVKVEGDEAFVTYSTPGIKSQIMYMKREGGKWRVGKVNADRLL